MRVTDNNNNLLRRITSSNHLEEFINMIDEYIRLQVGTNFKEIKKLDTI